LASKTSRFGKVLGGLGVLLAVGTAAGCAAPQFTYIADTSANAYFKVPYGWHRISDVSLAAQFKTPGSALGQAILGAEVGSTVSYSPRRGVKIDVAIRSAGELLPRSA